MNTRAVALANTCMLVLACASCTTAQMYDGARRERDDVARISGDYMITAGAPVSVILRQVDGRTLSLGQHAVDVLPGPHRLLVDCRVAETDSVTRHEIEAEVAAGRQYRLAAQTAPGLKGCSDVTLEAT